MKREDLSEGGRYISSLSYALDGWMDGWIVCWHKDAKQINH
jgi:hypothetical protein